MAEVIWTNPDWTPEEVPKLPGSPAMLAHSVPVRIRFAAIGVLCGITSNLGNALLTANLPQIQGNLGLTPVEGQWLLGAYVMMNCWGNLVLFKFRMQFGIHAFARLGLLAYAALAVLQIFVHDYETALATRAASGLAAAPLLGLTAVYFIQSAGTKYLSKGMMAGITIGQVVTPLAFIMVPTLNDFADPGLQYTFEAGLALCTLAAIIVFPLPYSLRVRVFEWQDVVSVALLAPGMALFVAVISQGRNQWWTDKPWIGVALAASLVLVVAGLVWEYGRRNPLIYTRWLTTGELLFFVAAAFLVRFLTTEQQIGAVGFLRAVGMGPDQLASLYVVIGGAALLGFATVLLLATPENVFWLILSAVALMLAGALLDRTATPQERLSDFYVSQAMLGFASALFVGPLLQVGLLKVMKEGTQYVITLITVFAFTQSVGLLLGSAVLNSYQLFSEHDASGAINAGLDATDPIVQQRLTGQSQLFSRLITDPGLRGAEGTAQLGASATLNATTIAYNAVFSLIAIVAAAFLVVMGTRFAVTQQATRRARRAERA